MVRAAPDSSELVSRQQRALLISVLSRAQRHNVSDVRGRALHAINRFLDEGARGLPRDFLTEIYEILVPHRSDMHSVTTALERLRAYQPPKSPEKDDEPVPHMEIPEDDFEPDKRREDEPVTLVIETPHSRHVYLTTRGLTENSGYMLEFTNVRGIEYRSPMEKLLYYYLVPGHDSGITDTRQ